MSWCSSLQNKFYILTEETVYISDRDQLGMVISDAESVLIVYGSSILMEFKARSVI